MKHILGLAALIRIIVSAMTPIISRDGTRFIAMAEYIKSFDMKSIIAEQYHPLYPLLIYIFNFSIPDLIVCAKFVSMLMGVLSVIPLYHLSKNLFGGQAAKASVIIYSLHPYFARFSADALSESTYTFFVLCGLLALYLSLTGLNKIRLSFLAGLASGLAYLTRPEGVGVVIISALFCLFYKFDGARLWKRALMVTAAFIGFFLISSPYLYLIKNTTGEWRITTKKPLRDFLPEKLAGKIFIKDKPAKPQMVIASSKVLNPPQNQSIKSNDGNIDKTTTQPAKPKESKDTGGFFSAFSETYHPFLLVFLIAGLIMAFREPMDKRQKTLLYIILCSSILYLYVVFGLSMRHYVSKRHFIPISAILLPFCGKAIDWLSSLALLSSRITRYLKTKQRIYWAIILLTAVVLLPKTLAPQRSGKEYIKEVASWLKLNCDTQSLFLADDPRITFYAKVKSVTLPKTHLDYYQFTHLIKSVKPKYIVADKDFMNTYLNGLNEALAKKEIKLSSIYKHADNKHGAVWYYLFECAGDF